MVVVILLSLVAVVANTNSKVELHQIEVKTKQQEIDLLQQKLETNEETEAKNKQELDKKLQENKKLQDEIRALQARKAEEARIAQANASNAVSASSQTATTHIVGDWVAQCHAWAKEAGIVLNDSAIKLLERESHCSPTVMNPTSSAGGIPQALPWTKMGCELSVAGAPCQLKWFQGYVMGRYGSYEAALAHSYSVGWY